MFKNIKIEEKLTNRLVFMSPAEAPQPQQAMPDYTPDPDMINDATAFLKEHDDAGKPAEDKLNDTMAKLRDKYGDDTETLHKISAAVSKAEQLKEASGAYKVAKETEQKGKGILATAAAAWGRLFGRAKKGAEDAATSVADAADQAITDAADAHYAANEAEAAADKAEAAQEAAERTAQLENRATELVKAYNDAGGDIAKAQKLASLTAVSASGMTGSETAYSFAQLVMRNEFGQDAMTEVQAAINKAVNANPTPAAEPAPQEPVQEPEAPAEPAGPALVEKEGDKSEGLTDAEKAKIKAKAGQFAAKGGSVMEPGSAVDDEIKEAIGVAPDEAAKVAEAGEAESPEEELKG